MVLAHRCLKGVLQLVLFVVLRDGRPPELPDDEEADDQPDIADPGEGGPPTGGGRTQPQFRRVTRQHVDGSHVKGRLIFPISGRQPEQSQVAVPSVFAVQGGPGVVPPTGGAPVSSEAEPGTCGFAQRPRVGQPLRESIGLHPSSGDDPSQRLLVGGGAIAGAPDGVPVDDSSIEGAMIRAGPDYRFGNEALDKNATRTRESSVRSARARRPCTEARARLQPWCPWR